MRVETITVVSGKAQRNQDTKREMRNWLGQVDKLFRLKP